jgi:hypothetical protein
MTEQNFSRKELCIFMLGLFPPIVRESILDSTSFAQSNGLEVSAQVTFGGSDLSFDQAEFFEAATCLYQNSSDERQIKSENGDEYILKLRSDESRDYLEASRGEVVINLPSFWFLSPEADYRLKRLESIFEEKNIFDNSAGVWKERLSAQPLDAAGFDDFLKYTNPNVVDVTIDIANRLASGSSSIASLVPSSIIYYNRLIGELKSATSLEDYISNVATPHINQLLRSDRVRGFPQSLLLAMHGKLSQAVDLAAFTDEEVENHYRWLSSAGDRFSQVAGVEVGLSIVEKRPFIEQYLVRIISEILDDDPEDENGRLKLSSSLFIFVDGELSRLGILRAWPPFARRLAALAQASIIERELIKHSVNKQSFSQWAMTNRSVAFYLQSLADLRLEPRWLPDFAAPTQIRAEFVSRIANASQQYQAIDGSSPLAKILAGDDGSVRSKLEFPFSFLPGPLEGGSTSPSDLPTDLIENLRNPNVDGVLTGKFFAGIVNSALVFRLTSDHAALVTQALRAANHRLSLDGESHLSFSLLSGLAMVAAVTRTPELAQDVRLLANLLQRRESTRIEPENLMRIAMIASASAEDVHQWCRLVGDWFSDFSYSDITPLQSKQLREHLRSLCYLVPHLWISCSKADAAFAAASG